MQDTLYELDYYDAAPEVDAKIEELNEQLDLHERVSGLVEYVEGITEPSMETVQVVLKAVDIALAGTRYTHEDFNVSVESAGTVAVSMEDVKTMLAALRKSVVATIQAIIEFLKKAWRMLTSNVERLEFRLKRAQSIAKSMRGRSMSVSGKIPVTAGQNYLKLNGKVVPNGSAIIQAMDQLNNQLSAVIDVYVPVVDDIGSKMISILGSNDDPETMLGNLNKEGSRLPVSAVASRISARGQVDSRWSLSNEVKVGPAVLGDKSLYCYTFQPRGTSALEAAKDILSFKVSFDANKNQRQVEGEIDVLSVDQVVAILGKIESTIKIVRKHDTDGVDRKMEGIKNAVERAVNNLAKRDSTKTIDETISRYSTTYAAWTTTPRVSILQHAVLCCESMITLCNRSLTHYR